MSEGVNEVLAFHMIMRVNADTIKVVKHPATGSVTCCYHITGTAAKIVPVNACVKFWMNSGDDKIVHITDNGETTICVVNGWADPASERSIINNLIEFLEEQSIE